MWSCMQEKGIEIFENTQPDGKTKQAFFFDPDGNLLWLSFLLVEILFFFPMLSASSPIVYIYVAFT